MPPLRTKWKRWFIDSAPARIVIFFLLVFVLGSATAWVFGKLGWMALDPNHPLRLTGGVIVRAVPPVLVYLFIVRFIEKRRAEELAWRRVLPDGAIGLGVGVLLVCTVIAVLWALGAYRVTGTTGDVQWLRVLLIPGLATAILEEIVFRGILFRIVEEWAGLRWALAVSALFFGGAHLGNPDANLWTSFAIAVEAGILLGVMYHVTRSLPLVMGVHMAWNFTQGAVFGSPVSGTTTSSWLRAELTGPAWLSGGRFGIEGSIVMVLLSLACSAALLAAHRRRTRQNGVVPAGAA